ncbi:hypothetical protein HNY73_007078 [Argiope bruennichi]|uniref:DUF4817 domain-containing protein n=1 Tax=Argiope bruennichi TaxID=94029 RepID=A0A8T0FFW0_ARGBR|nr:hypothetical protein HNY73_007078 [Argiope bruennichi]
MVLKRRIHQLVEIESIEMLFLEEKVVLVKLFYKDAESSSVASQAYRSMKDMRDGKGLMTCSTLTKMMQKFEATGSLASCARSGRPTALLSRQSNRVCNRCQPFLHTRNAGLEKLRRGLS